MHAIFAFLTLQLCLLTKKIHFQKLSFKVEVIKCTRVRIALRYRQERYMINRWRGDEHNNSVTMFYERSRSIFISNYDSMQMHK